LGKDNTSNKNLYKLKKGSKILNKESAALNIHLIQLKT